MQRNNFLTHPGGIPRYLKSRLSSFLLRKKWLRQSAPPAESPSTDSPGTPRRYACCNRKQVSCHIFCFLGHSYNSLHNSTFPHSCGKAASPSAPCMLPRINTLRARFSRNAPEATMNQRVPTNVAECQRVLKKSNMPLLSVRRIPSQLSCNPYYPKTHPCRRCPLVQGSRADQGLSNIAVEELEGDQPWPLTHARRPR